MTAEYFSSLALVTATVIYLLAFVMHTVEWASARGVASKAAAMEEADGHVDLARERVLVGATAPTGVTADRESTRGAAADDAVRDKPGTPTGTTARGTVKTEFFGRLGLAFTTVALACSIAGVIARGVAAQRWPLGNMFEFITMAMVIIVAAYLVLARRGMRWLGLPITLLATVGNGLAVTVFYVAVADLVPSLHSVWFLIHITAATISGAAFNVGGVISILYWLRRRAEERGSVPGYLAHLPRAEQMDVIAYRILAFAFPLWTFTIAAGAIWAEYAWGRYWGWDPKETWALVTWVIFACYLHARSTAGWKGRRAAIIAVVGLASFWFNFIGVNLMFAGLHSYAGI